MKTVRKRNKPVQEETYVVVNRDGQVFVGLKGGYPSYSDDYSEAKPLFIDNTRYLLKEAGTELINSKEL